jgi:hypothetical protein
MNIATLLLIAVSAAAWPANVNKAFLTSCVGQLLQSGSPMEDKRIQSITTRCLRQGAPKK